MSTRTFTSYESGAGSNGVPSARCRVGSIAMPLGAGLSLATALAGCSGTDRGRDVDGIRIAPPTEDAPHVVFQAAPPFSEELRSRAPGWARVTFQVDGKGRVRGPKAVDSSDSVFEEPAVSAVGRWLFEASAPDDESWRYNMIVKVTFPEEG